MRAARDIKIPNENRKKKHKRRYSGGGKSSTDERERVDLFSFYDK